MRSAQRRRVPERRGDDVDDARARRERSCGVRLRALGAHVVIFKLSICRPCARKLSAIVRERGEDAMAEALGKTLCLDCLKRVPGYRPDRELQARMKRTKPTPAGSA